MYVFSKVLLNLVLSSLIWNFMLHLNLLDMIWFTYVRYLLCLFFFFFFLTPKTVFVQLLSSFQ